jgi:hypothetical protein
VAGKFSDGSTAFNAALRRTCEMSEKVYVVRFKHPGLSTQFVIAASGEIHGDHLALLNSKGKLAALFYLGVVDRWFES